MRAARADVNATDDVVHAMHLDGGTMRTQKEIDATAKDEAPFSNHSEFEAWSFNVCEQGNGCRYDSSVSAGPERFCPILTVLMYGKKPAELLDEQGKLSGSCLEYEESSDLDTTDDHESPPVVEPVEPIPGQLDMFEGGM